MVLIASSEAVASVFDFRPSVVVHDRSLHLVGKTPFVAGLFFKIYEAGLYLDKRPVHAEGIVEKPLYLELVYSRPIKAQQFRDAANSILEAILPQEKLAQYGELIEAVHESYQDVKEGDRYGLSSVPGKGLTLFLNDREVIHIPDDGFARDYLQIWLGDHRNAEKMKKGLLP